MTDEPEAGELRPFVSVKTGDGTVVNIPTPLVEHMLMWAEVCAYEEAMPLAEANRLARLALTVYGNLTQHGLELTDDPNAPSLTVAPTTTTVRELTDSVNKSDDGTIHCSYRDVQFVVTILAARDVWLKIAMHDDDKTALDAGILSPYDARVQLSPLYVATPDAANLPLSADLERGLTGETT